MTLRHFEISFSLEHFLFAKLYLLFLMHILNHELKNSQRHLNVLSTTFYYLSRK